MDEQGSAEGGRAAEDPLLDALDQIVEAGAQNALRWAALKDRVDAIRAQRALGASYTDMALPDGLPVITALTANQEGLAEAAAHLRRTMARVLQSEGWSASAIARAFGVSRQRVAELLAPPKGSGTTSTEPDDSRPEIVIVEHGQDLSVYHYVARNAEDTDQP